VIQQGSATPKPSKTVPLNYRLVYLWMLLSPFGYEFIKIDFAGGPHSRPACNKLCVFSHDALDRHRHNPQDRPSRSFVDAVDLPWRNISSAQSLGVSLRWQVPLFLEIPEFLYNSLGYAKGSCRAKTSSIRSVVSIQHWLVTDGHTTTAYTALA